MSHGNNGSVQERHCTDLDPRKSANQKDGGKRKNSRAKKTRGERGGTNGKKYKNKGNVYRHAHSECIR